MSEKRKFKLVEHIIAPSVRARIAVKEFLLGHLGHRDVDSDFRRIIVKTNPTRIKHDVIPKEKPPVNSEALLQKLRDINNPIEVRNALESMHPRYKKKTEMPQYFNSGNRVTVYSLNNFELVGEKHKERFRQIDITFISTRSGKHMAMFVQTRGGSQLSDPAYTSECTPISLVRPHTHMRRGRVRS